MSTDETETLHRRLQALKQRGCNLLVTGEVREEVSHRMTQKLLGSPDLPRTRLLALTDQDRADVSGLLPGDVEPSDREVFVVEDTCETRAADAESSRHSTTDWGHDDLDGLQTTVCKSISMAKDDNSGFDAAELRVSLFTLSYLVNQHDTEAVEQFVSSVGDHVRGVSGMAHYHLPYPDDSATVRELAPLFDARIELREKQGSPEQRWHFPERDEPTSWVGL